MLASWDFRTAALAHGVDLQLACYTFGSPRVGNHTFARELDEVRCPCRPACPRGPAA